MSFGLCHFLLFRFEHKMEGELLKLLRQTKEAGGAASLSFFTTKDGKLKAKLEVELDPPAPASPGPTPPLPSTAPAPGGGRRRRKGASAKAKAKARAALHRATQAAATSSPPASGDASAPLEAHATHQQHHPSLRHPLHLLPSPSPSSGLTTPPATGDLTIPSLCAHLPAQRPLHIHPSPASDSGQRQVISFGRKKVPAHSFLNLDGSTLPPPSSLRSTTAAFPPTARSTINTTVTPWAPPLPINTTVNTPHHDDPQAAARLHACGLCRAGACLPAICDYRPTT